MRCHGTNYFTAFSLQGHNVVHVIMEESEEDFVVSWNDDPMLPMYLMGQKSEITIGEAVGIIRRGH